MECTVKGCILCGAVAQARGHVSIYIARTAVQNALVERVVLLTEAVLLPSPPKHRRSMVPVAVLLCQTAGIIVVLVVDIHVRHALFF